jgi:hypothetical protein
MALQQQVFCAVPSLSTPKLQWLATGRASCSPGRPETSAPAELAHSELHGVVTRHCDALAERLSGRVGPIPDFGHETGRRDHGLVPPYRLRRRRARFAGGAEIILQWFDPISGRGRRGDRTDPAVSGSVDQYKVTPALPSGMSLNPHSGVISGTPTRPSAAEIFVVSATGAGVRVTFPLVFSVTEPPNGLTYVSRSGRVQRPLPMSL